MKNGLWLGLLMYMGMGNLYGMVTGTPTFGELINVFQNYITNLQYKLNAIEANIQKISEETSPEEVQALFKQREYIRQELKTAKENLSKGLELRNKFYQVMQQEPEGV